MHCRHYYPEFEDINAYENTDNRLNKYGDEELNRAHIENMVQRYRRLSDGSLDPDNITKYRAKLSERENRLDEFGNNEFNAKNEQISVENPENSGTINFTEVYRKKSEQSDYGISQRRFDELTIEEKKNGATILRGTDEIEKHLDSVNAQAATIGDVMLFRKKSVFVTYWKKPIISCKTRKALTMISQNRFGHI